MIKKRCFNQHMEPIEGRLENGRKWKFSKTYSQKLEQNREDYLKKVEAEDNGMDENAKDDTSRDQKDSEQVSRR